MVNHSLTNFVHHASRTPRGGTDRSVRALLDRASASSVLCSRLRALLRSADQRCSMPVTVLAVAVAVVMVAVVVPVSMTVTAPAVVAISATINAALAVAIPDHEVVAFAFAIVAAAPIAVAAPAPADWTAADGVIVRPGAADSAADGAGIGGRILA